MDLTTRYLGLRLKNPFMVGASPLVDDLSMVERMAHAGSSAIVMHSLFEEQIAYEELNMMRAQDMHSDSHPEASDYLPEPSQFALTPDNYLECIRQIKRLVDVPVIASLNGVTPGWWMRYSKEMEQAGADALELNIYYVAANPDETSLAVEQRATIIAREVKRSVQIPVAVKLSPFYSSMMNLAKRFEEVKVDGLILFNRFYQPDFDIENLEVVPELRLSNSSELLLRLRWTALLYGKFNGSLAISGGVHTPSDAIKALMAGADVVQCVSAVLKHGPTWLTELRAVVTDWMERKEYVSINQLRGSLSAQSCPDPAAFERANYMKILQTWRA